MTTGGTTIDLDADPVPVEELPSIDEMPDPLTMSDGTPVTSKEQWTFRRMEMKKILEDYTYGHMPPPPGNVSSSVVTPTTGQTIAGVSVQYRMLHLTFGPNESLGFDLGLFFPESDAETPHPILVNLGFNAGEGSAAQAAPFRSTARLRLLG